MGFHMSLALWNNVLALLVIIGAFGSVYGEWWADPNKNNKFDPRYLWFAAGPVALGVLQGTVITPIFDPQHAVISQIISALTAGAGLTRVATLAGRKAGIHPRKQEDMVIKEEIKEKEEKKNDLR